LLHGKSAAVVQAEFQKQEISKEAKFLLPFKVFAVTNQRYHPIDKLSPRTLGSLIAMYEHNFLCKDYLEYFSFDQWGVELGKQLANSILRKLIQIQFKTMIALHRSY
jgi:glucose-6-phosphate isomerase